MSGPNIFFRYVLLTLAGFAALAVILSLVVSRVLTFQMTDRESRSIAHLVRTITSVDLTEDQFSEALAAADPERFWNLFRHLRQNPEIVRLKIYDSAGRLVWSDDPRNLPPPAAPNPQLQGALAGGVTTNIGMVKPEHRFEVQQFGQRLLEMYVPLQRSKDRSTYAVVEVYEVPTALDAQIAASRRWVWALSLGATSIIFASLTGLFWRAWRREQKLSDQLNLAHRFNTEVLENAPFGLILADHEGNVLAWNAALGRMCACVPDQQTAAKGRLQDLRPEWLGEALAAQAQEAFRTRALVSPRGVVCPGCELADQFWCTILAIPILAGHPAACQHVLLVIEDVTQVRRLRDQLAHSERLGALGELYAGLSHEINNPLGIIMTKIRILLADGRERGIPQDLLRDLEVVDRHTGRIAEIIRDLLKFARRPTSEMARLDLNGVVRDALALVEKPFAKDGIQIHADLAAGPLPVFGNLNELQQVLVNLMTNARDAMPSGGHLTVHTHRQTAPRKCLVAEVTDTGTGIATERLQKIFDPFFTTKEVGRGTGLGLSVSYAIVRSHGGTIEVASEVGAGSTFRIILPLLDGDGQTHDCPGE